ncbi:MAG: MgtC/SapB family protein, partial [Clostridiaceae bacterium]|nr:MgtC/SapB family protein [Clostridiaceae bacterium]
MIWYDILIRLALAIFVGGLIGYEREYTNRPAGFRTHILVCVGATVATMVEISMTNDTIKMILQNPALGAAIRTDMGRFGAQVITGIGFLGAGTILHDKGSIKGLTTAASIWGVACIGLAVGSGYYFLSISSAISVYIVLVTFKKIESRYIDKLKTVKLEIKFN